MPVGPLPPLRFLLSPLPVIRYFPMSLNSVHQPSSSLLTFRRIFPFKLKYLGLRSGIGFPPRNFSSRSFRSRSDSGPRYPRDEVPKAAALSKSLIEDEDDLSDWVSGLRTSSIRSGVFTEDEEDEDRGQGKKRGQLGKRGRESNFASSDSDEERGFGKMGKKGFQNSSNLGSAVKDSQRFGRKFGGEDERREKRIRGGMREGVRGEREFGPRNGRDEGNRRGGRIGREREFGVKEGMKGKDREFGARDEWGEGNRGGGRMGREREFGVRNGRNEVNRGGGRIDRGGKGGGRRAAFVSAEEEEDEFELGYEKEKSVSGFLDLIGDEDSEEDADDDDEEVVIRSRSSLFANEGEKLSSGPSSPDRGDSYLSETRSVFYTMFLLVVM